MPDCAHVSRIVSLLCATLLSTQLENAAAFSMVRSRHEATPSFHSYVQEHNRPYSAGSEEYESRRIIFERRARRVDRHNAQSERLWTASVGKFGDRTEAELRSIRGWKPSGVKSGIRGGSVGGSGVPATALRGSPVLKAPLPEAHSWTNLAAMRIKDQGECGSCWAVSAISVLEAHYEIHRGESKQFSVQEIIACAQNPKHCGGSGGCDGATAEIAFQFVLKHGLLSEAELPYEQQNGTCPSSIEHSTKAAARMRVEKLGMWGWERLPKNKYEPLVRALYENGPVVVALGVMDTEDPIMFYRNGIYNGCNRDVTLDHALVLAGFGTDTTGANRSVKYWLLHNSWGTGWGEEGKLRLLRTDNEQGYCGTDYHPEEGSGCKGGPSQVHVCGNCGVLYESVYPKFHSITSSTSGRFSAELNEQTKISPHAQFSEE